MGRFYIVDGDNIIFAKFRYAVADQKAIYPSDFRATSFSVCECSTIEDANLVCDSLNETHPE